MDSNDLWKIDLKTISKVWRSSIRVRLILAENEISSLNYSNSYDRKKNMQNLTYTHPILDYPYGVDLLIGRNAYLLEASKEIISHFHSFSLEYLEVVRLCYKNISLNLSLPLGVLYDTYCNEDIMEIFVHFQPRVSSSSSASSSSASSSSTSNTINTSSSISNQTSITLGRKSQTFPSIPYNSHSDWTRKNYLHSVKQAYNLLTNSNMQLVKPELQNLLFNSCQIGEVKTFLSIFNILFPLPSINSNQSDETRRSIPIRLIKKDLITNNIYIIQKFISKDIYLNNNENNQSDSYLTLRSLLINYFLINNLDENLQKNKKFIIIQGISITSLLNYPITYIWNHLMSGDFFLYIIINENEENNNS